MKRMLDQKIIDFLNSLGGSLKYDSSSNTFEIDTNLYVDGKATFNSEILSNNDGGLYLYDNEGDNENVNIYAFVSDNTLYIEYNNSDNADLNVSVQIPILSNSIALTTANTKTLFGNQSLEGSGNIDLYRHTVKLTTNIGTYFCEIISSNNLVIDSVQDLTSILNAKRGTKIYGFKELGPDNAPEALFFSYSDSTWAGTYPDSNITNCSDTVTTI